MLQQFEVAVEHAQECATCPLFKPFNDGTGRGLCCGVADTSLVVREHHTLTQDCQNLIDEQAVAQAELNTHIEIQAQEIAPLVEVDSDTDADFGVLYRVWAERTLLGTFYQAADAHWIAQPSSSHERPRCDTSDEAQLLIVALAGLLVAGNCDEVVDLLDKPFDELTVADWAAIKQRSQQAEMVAA